MLILECEQGTTEWLEARRGIITASCMKDVLAKGQGKTRETFMLKLIGEIFTGEPSENYSNAHMQRGHEMEGQAREIYAAIAPGPVSQVGFIRNHDDIGGIGYSPDALVGDDGLAEVKTRLPHLQAALLLADKVPPEHWAQLQAGLWVTGRAWLDFVSYWPGMPLFRKRVFPDPEYQKQMRDESIRFYAEMKVKIQTIRSL